jgi:hypothetical protein
MDANTPVDKYAPTTWGAVAATREFKCPSGQYCLIKEVSLSDLMQAGLLDEMDTLGALMQQDVIAPAQGKGKKPSDRQAKKPTKAEQAKAEEDAQNKAVMELMKNPEQFQAMSRMIERMVPIIVVKPGLVSPWTKNEAGQWVKLADRVDGVIYSDSVDFGDQMALFGEAMADKKMGDIAAFRDEAESGVDAVEDGGGVSLPAE